MCFDYFVIEFILFMGLSEIESHMLACSGLKISVMDVGTLRESCSGFPLYLFVYLFFMSYKIYALGIRDRPESML